MEEAHAIINGKGAEKRNCSHSRTILRFRQVKAREMKGRPTTTEGYTDRTLKQLFAVMSAISEGNTDKSYRIKWKK
jgi:hypothetical protein